MPVRDTSRAADTYADVAGQIAYYERYGDFPVDQRGYVSAFIESEQRALAWRW